MKRAVITIIRFYQVALSPYWGWGCRFSPTCSQYMIESLQIWGVLRGLLKGLRRLMRCHPFSQGGWDPVEVTEHGLNGLVVRR